MADNMDELREEFEQLKKEYQSLFRGDQVPFKEMAKPPAEAKRQIKFFKDGILAAKREASGLSGIFNDLNKQLRANLSELDRSNDSINTGKKAYRQLTDVVRDLADEEAGISRLTFKQLKTNKLRGDSNIKLLTAAAKQLQIEKGITNESQLRNASSELLTDSERALLAASFQNFRLEQRANEAVTRRLELERNVLDTVKLTGGALNGIGNLAASLGLSGFAESLDEIKSDLDDKLRKKIRDAAIDKFDTNNSGAYKKTVAEIKNEKAIINDLQTKIAEQEGEATKEQLDALDAAQIRLETAEDQLDKHEKIVQTLYKEVKAASTLEEKFTALGEAVKEFANQLSDPLVLLASMVKGYMAVDEAATDFQRTTGQNVRSIAAINSSLVSSVDTIELMSNFAKETNMNLNGLFSSEEVGRIALAGKELGIGAEGAAKLAMNLKLSGQNVDSFEKNAFAAGKEMVNTGAAGVNLGKALQDTVSTSDAIALSLGNSPKELMKANIEAQRLGLSLDKLDGIASSMLDFESSIQAELEAQLLTGKNINLSRAREAALNNDLATLGKEILNNNALSNDFGKSNRIQQESMAKALGMSRDELAKMIVLEKLRGGLSAEEVARQQNMSLESVKQMSAQDKFNTAIQKLQQSLGPVLDALVPIVDLLLKPLQLLGKAIAIITQFGPAIRESIGKPLDNAFGGIFSSINKGLDAIMKSPFGSILKLLAGAVGGIITFKVGAALAAWATRGTFFNPMVTTDIKGGGITNMFKGMFKGGGFTKMFKNSSIGKLLFGKKIGGQFLKGGGRATAGTIKGGLIPTIKTFFKGIGPASKSISTIGKFLGPMLKFAGILGMVVTIGQLLYDGYNNIKEFGLAKGLGKTVEDNLFTILLGAVGMIFGPLGSAIGMGIGALLDNFDLGTKLRKWWGGQTKEMKVVIGLMMGPFSLLLELLDRVMNPFGSSPKKQEVTEYNSSERPEDFQAFNVDTTKPKMQDFISRPNKQTETFDRGDIVVGLRPQNLNLKPIDNQEQQSIRSEAVASKEQTISTSPVINNNFDLSSLENKLDELVNKVASIRGDVIIDGNKAGQAIFASATNLS